MSIPPTEGKPGLRVLCYSHGINLLQLARESNIHPLLAWDALIGNATTKETAHMLLCGLNALAGTNYTLNDIQLKLVEER